MIIDLVRNGKAHQYQSPIVKLSDGCFDVDLTGAMPGCELTKPNRPPDHLGYRILSSGDLSLRVRSDQLFLDIKQAIEDSQILSDNPVDDIVRPKPGKPYYGFTVADLLSALKSNHHPAWSGATITR
jgi:hypothetical protein